MNQRDLFRAIMYYEGADRMPVVHWSQWPETLERWYSEGLPRDTNIHDFLGTRPHWAGIGAHLGLWPGFEEETIEETDTYRIVRQTDGVICKAWKQRSCIPQYLDFTLRTAADWPDFKRRLQPSPERLPADLDQRLADAEASGLPVVIGTASLMGWIRNWMGVENMSYLMYDDRDCYRDMVETLADLTCWSLDQIIPRMRRPPDMGFGWEDICGRSGPLVSPDIFDECVAPGYRKIRAALERHGVFLLGIDSDGDVGPLIGHWLDAGVNVQFPIEVGPWNGDGLAYRRRYGRNLRIIGNYDKLQLEKGREAIVREIERRIPLMKDGGYMLMPDHLITPGVPLDDYRFFLDQMRRLRF